MKKTAYIHIGLHKTGSTAIQETLRRLRREGKLDKFDMQCHTSDIGKPIINSLSVDDEQYFIEYIHKKILKYSRKLGEKNVILSHEDFGAKFHNDYWGFRYDLQSALAAAFKGYNIKIIVYIRRQDLFIESRVNQSVKTSFNTLYSKANFYYKELIDSYVSHFGRENVIVRRFEKESLYKNDVVADFLHIVGLDELIEDYAAHKKVNTNISMTPRAFRIAMADNQQYLLSEAEIKSKIEKFEKQYEDGLISKDKYGNLAATCLNGLDATQFSWESVWVRDKLLQRNSNVSIAPSKYGFLGAEERAKILSKYAEDNAAVAREYFGIEDGRLFNDKIPTNVIDMNCEPSTNDIVQTFMPIIIELSQRCKRLESSPFKRFIIDRRGKIMKIIENLERYPKLYNFLYKRFKHSLD